MIQGQVRLEGGLFLIVADQDLVVISCVLLLRYVVADVLDHVQPLRLVSPRASSKAKTDLGADAVIFSLATLHRSGVCDALNTWRS